MASFFTTTQTARPARPADGAVGASRRCSVQTHAVTEQAPRSEGAAPLAESFIRPHLLKLAAYTPIEPFEILSAKLGRRPQDIVKLDANENPYGPPPEVLQALGSMSFPNIYPDPETRQLRKALADWNGVPMEHLLVGAGEEDERGAYTCGGGTAVGGPPRPAHRPAITPFPLQVGCGADELIDLLMRCVLEPGDKIVDLPPTFTMYAFDAAVNNAQVVTVPRLEGFRIDVEGERGASWLAGWVVQRRRPCCEEGRNNRLEVVHTPLTAPTPGPAGVKRAVREHAPKIVFLTSPNNPDGSMLSREDLLEILALPVLVVLDEAYIEFSDEPSKLGWVATHSNLVVLRTFSKCAALAGLRVGYGAFPLGMIDYIWRAKQPYNVSVASETAAVAALSNLPYIEVRGCEAVRRRLPQGPFGLPARWAAGARA